MTSQSEISPLLPQERRDYGAERVRNAAFGAVRALWDRRRREGMQQTQIADAIGRDPAWISRTLRGPGNWTLQTFGEMVEALNGEAEIIVNALEDELPDRPNYDAYQEYAGFSEKPGAQAASTGTFIRGTIQVSA